MANNELSGPIVSLALANFFKKKKLNYSIRFLFIPETIGSISYLKKNIVYLKKYLLGGYNLSCVGDERKYSFMRSKNGNSTSDQILIDTLRSLKLKSKEYSFLERGSDERQYNWPGIDLNITSFFRSKYYEYKEYHSSLDQFDKVVTKKGLKGSFNVMKKVLINFQKKIFPISTTMCEPFMTKRKEYYTLSKKNSMNKNLKDIMNFLIYSDGKIELNKISKLIKLSYKKSYKLYVKLRNKKLVF